MAKYKWGGKYIRFDPSHNSKKSGLKPSPSGKGTHGIAGKCK